MDNPEDYTVLLIAQCGLILACFVVYAFTLRVMSSFAAIHGNCKFFLLFTALGQFLIMVAHSLKIAYWLGSGNYDRFNMYTQPLFKSIQPINEVGYFLTDLNNFCLIIERTIACTRLKSYEETSAHWPVLIAAEALCMAAAGYCAYLIHFAGKMVESGIIALAVAVISLSMLALCYLYSRRAYGGLEGVGSRYQMREVEYVTRALLPACLITVLLRGFVTAMALFANAFITLFPSYIIFMTAYHCIQTINSAQYGLVIVLIHESMRIRAKNMLLSCCGGASVSPRISTLDKRKDTHRAVYFDQLRIIWD